MVELFYFQLQIVVQLELLESMAAFGVSEYLAVVSKFCNLIVCKVIFSRIGASKIKIFIPDTIPVLAPVAVCLAWSKLEDCSFPMGKVLILLSRSVVL